MASDNGQPGVGKDLPPVFVISSGPLTSRPRYCSAVPPEVVSGRQRSCMEGCQPMAKVLFFLLLTVAGSGLAAYAAWNSELWEAWVEAKGYVRGDRAFDFGLKAFVAAVAGVPLTLLIGALLPVGAALFLAYPLVDPAAPHPWAFQGGALLVLLAIPVTLRASIRMTAPRFRSRTHAAAVRCIAGTS